MYGPRAWHHRFEHLFAIGMIPPAIAGAAITEFFAVRSWAVHVIGGALVAFLAIALRTVVFSATAQSWFFCILLDEARPEIPVPMVMLFYFLLIGVPGAIGGLVYWAIVGRHAGSGWSQSAAERA